jgi:hypothetical protein
LVSFFKRSVLLLLTKPPFRTPPMRALPKPISILGYDHLEYIHSLS